MTARSHIMRLAPALLVVAASPAIMGPGRCGFLIDYTETLLVNEPFTRLVLAADDGSVIGTVYEREAGLIKRHVSGFEPSMGRVDHEVESGVLTIEARCKYEGNCTFDHMLEIPRGVDFEVTMKDSRVSLGYVDGDIDVDILTGWFRGVRLESPNLTISVGEGAVTHDPAVAPESLTITVGAGDVAIELPPGAYRCELNAADGEVKTAGVTCDDAAIAVLAVDVEAGDITVEGVAP